MFQWTWDLYNEKKAWFDKLAATGMSDKADGLKQTSAFLAEASGEDRFSSLQPTGNFLQDLATVEGLLENAKVLLIEEDSRPEKMLPRIAKLEETMKAAPGFGGLEKRIGALEEAVRLLEEWEAKPLTVQVAGGEVSFTEWAAQLDLAIADIRQQLKETAGKEGFENLRVQIVDLKKQLEGLPKTPQYEALAKRVTDEVGKIPSLVKEEVGKQPAAAKNGGGYVHQTDLDDFVERIASGLARAIAESNLGRGDKQKIYGLVVAAKKWWDKKPGTEEAS